MFPLRKIAESLGYAVSYTPLEVTLSSASKVLKINKQAGMLYDNGHHMYLQSEPQLIENVLYAPITFLQDHLRLSLTPNQGYYSISARTENQLEIVNQAATFEDPYLKMDLQFPRLEGLAQTKQLNSAIQAKVTSLVKTALQDREGLMAGKEKPRHQYDYYLNYLVKRNQGKLLSLLFEDYYFTGGAHGMGYKFSYNFNLATGRQYSLADLFSDGVDYLALLNGQIRRQIAADKHMADAYHFDSIAPEQVFYLTDNALVICFQSYEIGPYSEGKPEFTLPFSQLESALSPQLKEFL
jgi:hypothetical protein